MIIICNNDGNDNNNNIDNITNTYDNTNLKYIFALVLYYFF